METAGKHGIGERSRQLPPRAGASPTEGAPMVTEQMRHLLIERSLAAGLFGF